MAKTTPLLLAIWLIRRFRSMETTRGRRHNVSTLNMVFASTISAIGMIARATALRSLFLHWLPLTRHLANSIQVFTGTESILVFPRAVNLTGSSLFLHALESPMTSLAQARLLSAVDGVSTGLPTSTTTIP